MDLAGWWTAFWNGALSLGRDYGVDPLVFAAIYVGAIPFFSLSLGWLLRNLKTRRSLVLPGLATGFFFISAYLYLILAGRNVPWWVYAAVAALVIAGALSTGLKIRAQTRDLYEYDWVALGGGAAGLVGAGIGAAFGAKTLLIEQHRLGGDCTWTGCVPSKTLLAAAREGLSSREALARVRAVRQHIYEEADSPERMQAQNVEILEGRAVFTDPHSLDVTLADGQVRRVTARKILIAAGSRAGVPPVPGLETVPYLTNENLFELEEAPARLLVLGGGPIGLEMAQAFRGLGSAVTVFEAASRLLPRDPEDFSARLRGVLESEGIEVHTGAAVARVEALGAGGQPGVRLTLGDGRRFEGDRLLVAAGRVPRVEGLGLDKAGVRFSAKGIPVNRACRTNVGHIYAIGDVTGQPAFTHWAEHMAKNAAAAALLGVPLGLDRDRLPWATYTHPELAHVGLGPEDLRRRQLKFGTYAFPYGKLDRALTENQTEGEIRIYAAPNGRILGADIYGAQAGDLIAQVGIALKARMKLADLASVIYPYPSWALGVRRAADQWYLAQKKASTVRLLQKVYGFRGPAPVQEAPGIL